MLHKYVGSTVPKVTDEDTKKSRAIDQVLSNQIRTLLKQYQIVEVARLCAMLELDFVHNVQLVASQADIVDAGAAIAQLLNEFPCINTTLDGLKPNETQYQQELKQLRFVVVTLTEIPF